MLIVIDDINGLSDSKEFVNWYKRIADTIIVDKHYRIPAYFVLAGYPEKFDNLVEVDSSFGRIFNYDHVDNLNDSDVKEFFEETFNDIGVETNDECLDLMVKYSSGVPLTMQQIGDSVFWNLESDKLAITDTKSGIIQAAFELGNKQIRKTLNRIKSEKYEKMLIKLVSGNIIRFKRKDLINLFSSDDVDEFLNRMINISLFKVIEDLDGDEYVFSDMVYYTYFNIISSRDDLVR